MVSRELAIKLRIEGYSYSYIATQTGLSKSTLSYHLREIKFTPNKEMLQKLGHARAQAAKTKATQKQASLLLARMKAKKDIGRLTQRDLFMLGLGVYIGEGSKTQDLIRIVNADYRVINLFTRWLCTLGFSKENFTIRLHLYPDSNIKEAELFWVSKTGLARSQFQKVCIDTRVGKDRKRSGKYAYGTAHVTVRSNGVKPLGVAFSRLIGAWMEEVLE